MSTPKEMKLTQLNHSEARTLIAGLELLALQGGQLTQSVARIMLEDDAKFVRTLFWLSEKG
jgi:hypothetical protein